MAKLPWMKFFVGDWVQDTRPLSCEAKGAWIDILCSMWLSPIRGKLTIPVSGYARIIGTDKDNAQTIIDELTRYKICDSVTESNGDVTLISRRMAKDEKERGQTKKRVQKYRDKDKQDDCNDSVTLEMLDIRSQKVETREEIQEKKREDEDGATIVATPSKIATEFFSQPEKQQELVEVMVNKGADRLFIEQQVRGFVDYWTELNKSGTKQRWQLEPTFEVQRRLKTWFDRAGKFGKLTERKGIRL